MQFPLPTTQATLPCKFLNSNRNTLNLCLTGTSGASQTSSCPQSLPSFYFADQKIVENKEIGFGTSLRANVVKKAVFIFAIC